MPHRARLGESLSSHSGTFLIRDAGMKILIIGSGGREHALAWSIFDSPLCDELIIAQVTPALPS